MGFVFVFFFYIQDQQHCNKLMLSRTFILLSSPALLLVSSPIPKHHKVFHENVSYRNVLHLCLILLALLYIFYNKYMLCIVNQFDPISSNYHHYCIVPDKIWVYINSFCNMHRKYHTHSWCYLMYNHVLIGRIKCPTLIMLIQQCLRLVNKGPNAVNAGRRYKQPFVICPSEKTLRIIWFFLFIFSGLLYIQHSSFLSGSS